MRAAWQVVPHACFDGSQKGVLNQNLGKAGQFLTQEHVKNKDSIIPNGIALPDHPLVVNKEALSRPMRSKDAEPRWFRERLCHV